MTREELEALVDQKRREALEEARRQPPPPPVPPRTIHYTELPEGRPESPLCQEWNYYRREVGHLLAEGNEGKWVLIKGEQVIGIWDTFEEARHVASQRYLMQPVLIHQIQTREPLLRLSTRVLQWLG